MSKKRKLLIAAEVLFILAIPFMWSNDYIGRIVDGKAVLMWCWRFCYLLRIFFLFHLLSLVLKRFYVQVIKAKMPEKQANKKLLYTTLLSFLILAEIAFSFIPQSQGNGQVDLGQRLWQVYYARPVNELGYRDENIKERANTGKRKVFFLGDSFTFGNGIEKAADRYPDLISRRLNNRFEVFNLGRCESDTGDEFARLKAYEVKPDIVVLQYFHNDIVPTAMKYGFFDYKKNRKNASTKALMVAAVPFKCSFFLNFILVNLGNRILTDFYTGWYKDDIQKSYENTGCLKEHLADVSDLVNYCKTNNIKLYVLFMPDLTDIAFTQQLYVKNVVPLLQQENIQPVFIDGDLQKYSAPDLVVNSVDMHANEFVQTIIADKLMDAIPEFKMNDR